MGGGNDAISDSLMSEYESASSKGNATMSEPTISNAYLNRVPVFTDRRLARVTAVECAAPTAASTLTGTRSLVQFRSSARVDCGRPGRPRSLVMHPSLADAELDDRERHHEQQQDHRLRARESELEVLERVLIDAVDEHSCGIDGPAAGHHVDLGKGLKHGDGVDDKKKEQRRRPHRDGDPREHPQPARTVEPRGFVDLLGDALQS